MKGGNVISYFLAGAVPRLAMFVILFVLARRLSIKETGLFVLVTTIGEVLEMIFGNWLRVFIQSREAGQGKLRSLRGGRIVGLALAMYTLAALAILPVAWIVAEERIAAFALAVFAYVTAFALLRLVLAVQQVTHNHALFTRIELARGILIMLTVVAATMVPGATFVGPALALSGTTLLAGLAGAWFGRAQMARPRLVRKGLATARRFGLPIVADTTLSFIVIYFERFVLNEVLGPASVGVYAIAYALGRQPVDFIAGPMNTMTVPMLFAARARQGDAVARSMQSGFSITLFVLCAGALTGTALLAEPVAALFVKPELQADTARLMPIIALAACFVVFKTFLYDNLFFMLGRNGLKLASILPAAVLGAGLGIVLIRQFGLIGAAVAAAGSAALALCASIVATRSFFRFPLPWLRLGGVALAASAGGLALWVLRTLAIPYGPLAELLAGFAGFTVAYAAALTVQGISIRAMLKTPWAPLAVTPSQPA